MKGAVEPVVARKLKPLFRNPDSRLIEVFALAKGTYQLHARGVGAEKVNSKLLAGLKVTFDQLES